MLGECQCTFHCHIRTHAFSLALYAQMKNQGMFNEVILDGECKNVNVVEINKENTFYSCFSLNNQSEVLQNDIKVLNGGINRIEQLFCDMFIHQFYGLQIVDHELLKQKISEMMSNQD